MRLAPRTKFNYYVRFEVNSTALKSKTFSNKHINEFGLLIKTTDLPKFTFDTQTYNQYNRKRIVYRMINYDAINMTFHDDNQGVVSALWAMYYGYYIKDRQNNAQAFTDTALIGTKDPRNAYRYGLDSDKSEPLFKNVTIYTMGRRRFVGYTLVNPKIKMWQQGQMDYADASSPAESQMTLEYEAVQYSSGTVSEGSPKGFATLHYDNSPSPLTVAGGGTGNLLGEGGVLDGLESVFGAIGDGTAFSSPQGFLSTAIGAFNTYKGVKGLSKESLKAEAINVLSSPAGVTSIANTISGVAGAIFPKSTPSEAPVKAVPRQIVSGQGARNSTTEFVVPSNGTISEIP
jgi:hypothetical protein